MLYPLLKPFLFALEPETAHDLALASLRLSEPLVSLLAPWLRVNDPRLERTVFGLKFPNPVGLAAGIDKKAALTPVWEKIGFGFAELGTFTAQAQPGNPKPRVFRLKAQKALINRMGFPNPGARAAAKHLKDLKEKGHWPQSPVGLNIGKSKLTALEKAADDYLESLEALGPYADYLAVNVSSPNTPGLRKLQEAKPLRALLRVFVKNAKDKPVLLKLAPDLERKALLEAADIALSAGCAGLIATNTTITRLNLPTGDYPVGGLSGGPLREKADDILRELSKFTKGKVPLIGVGGILTAEDVKRKFEAGASLVQIYTGYI
ncbi:MAG: quinone-dependent dihydroorotate dehydrogenase, partial [bacterium]